MNKKWHIAIDVIVIIIAGVFLFFGVKDAIDMYNKSKISDNIKFSRVFSSVDKDNIYKYIDLDETIKLLDSSSGLILIGKTTDPWMQVLVNPLEDISKDYIENINYLELDELDTTSKKFKNLTDKVGDSKSFMIIIVKDGEIITKLKKSDIVDEDYNGAPIEYFSKEKIEELKEKLNKISSLT